MAHDMLQPTPDFMQKLTGKIRFRITNAYMFVAVLQKDQESLCHLLASLLHMERDEILSIKILNPIVLGEAVDEKDCVLDLLVLLNNNRKINLELQLENEDNWDNRSIYYLARKLCDLESGADYNDLKPMVHIGILDFNYPKENQEFYQEYFLMNRKTHRIYSDKIQLNVLCLTKIENATPQEHESGLYEWAKFFKATTWEELKELAANNQMMHGTIMTLAQLSDDEKIRQQCERREKYERDRISAINFGKREGRSEGELYKLIEQTRKKLSKGKSPELIAEELEEAPETIRKICDAAARFAPEYDCEKIAVWLKKQSAS